jgi:ABC-type sugar transport system permease subunit
MKPAAPHSVRPHPAWAPWFFLGPALLLFAVFSAWPLARSLVLAFEQTFGPGTKAFVGTRNFSFLFGDPLFWKAVGNTALYTLGSLVLQLPISLGLALLLNRPSLRGRNWFRLVFFAPSLVGLAYAAVLVSVAFEKGNGLINLSLHVLFSSWSVDFPWLDQHIVLSLVLASLWLYAGFNMVYFLAALQNVSPDLLHAASIDGANAWQRFRHVIFPEIRPVAGFVVLLSLTGSFQLFELPYIIFNASGNAAGPGNGGLTIVMYLYQTGFLAGDLGYASAIGWVLAILLMALALLHRWLDRGEEH